MRCPNKKHADWKALVSQVGETGAYQLYVENGFDIPSTDSIQTSTLEERIAKRDAFNFIGATSNKLGRSFYDSEFSSIHAGKISKKIVQKLEKLTGIEVRVISNAEMNELVGNDSNYDTHATGGFYLPGSDVVYLNIEHANVGLAVHEAFAHPFLLAIKEQNPKLYENLLERAKAVKEIDDVVKERGYSDEIYDSGIEHFTYAMEKHFNDLVTESDSNKSALNRLKTALGVFFKQVNMLVRDIFGLNSIPNLNSNTTIGQLADIISNSNEKYFLHNIGTGLTATEILEARIPVDKVTDVTAIHNIYAENGKDMDYYDPTHVYTNLATGVPYQSISKSRDYSFYGDTFEPDYASDEEQMRAEERYSWSSVVGTAIHGFAEAVFRGQVFDQSQFDGKIHIEVQKELGKIFSFYRDRYDIIASEQQVYNHDKKLAGTVDLLLKDKATGEIIQLDFKTKASNYRMHDGTTAFPKDKSNFTYYHSTTFGRSDYQKHFYQQWSYKRMQELLGIKIDKIGIIPIEIMVDVAADKTLTVTGAKLTKELELGDKRYYELKPDVTIINHVDSLQGIELDSRTELELVGEEAVLISELAKAGLVTLQRRAAALSLSYRDYESDIMYEKLAEINNPDLAPVVQAYMLIQAAMDSLGPINEEFQAYERLAKDKGDSVWPLAVMNRWKTFGEAFQPLLEQYRDAFNEFPQMFSSVEGFDADHFTASLDRSLSLIGQFRSRYKRKGMDQMLKAFVPVSTSMRNTRLAKFKHSYKLEFLEKQKRDPNLKFDANERKKMNEAALQYVKDNEENILNDSEAYLRAQSKLADHDVAYIYRFADTIFRSKDPLVGTMSKYFYNQLTKYKNQRTEWQTDLTNIMLEFNKLYDKNTLTDKKKVYDYMLTYDDKGRGYMVDSFSKDFMDAVYQMREEIDSTTGITKRDASIKFRRWLDSVAPMTEAGKKRYKKARLDHIESVRDMGIVSEEEYQMLIRNESLAKPTFPKGMIENNQLNAEAAYKLDALFRESELKNRTPNKKDFPNTKFEAIMAMDESDPRRKLYEFFRRTVAYNDMQVPGKFKLGNRIPGVRKDFIERQLEGQGLWDSIKEGLADTFQSKVDDDTRGMSHMYELANELGQSIDQIPVHFIGRVDGKDQSFDLPTIFKMYNDSVTYYTNISEILPELEFAKFIINDRGIKKTRYGKQIKNVIDRRFQKDTGKLPEEESHVVISDGGLLAEQVNDWFAQHVYKNSDRYIGSFMGIDTAKAIRFMQNMTSMKVMGLNLMSMVNNAAMAEVSQAVMVAANIIMTPKSYTKATKIYVEELPEVLADIGTLKYKSKLNLAMEFFGIFDDMSERIYRDKSVFARLAKESALHFTTQIGEHEAQGRFLIGALLETEVFNLKGESLGNLWDNLVITEEGYMRINPEVSQDHIELQSKVSRAVIGASWELHGNYHQFSSPALSANAIASLLQQFRKWAVPGFDRRFARKYYSEFDEREKYGYIRGGLNIGKKKAMLGIMSLQRMFGMQYNELKANKLKIATDWNMMEDSERQAVAQTLTDAIILSTLFVLSMLMFAYKDDDEYKKLSDTEKAVYDNILYQTYRITVEQRSYFSITEGLSMMQSPVPTTNLAVSWLGLAEQATSDLFSLITTGDVERYKTGSKKGDSKLGYKAFQQIPVARQVYRVVNPESSLNALTMPLQ